MSKGQDPQTVKIGGGAICPKCGQLMQRFEHSPDWRPQPGRGYFVFWDRCLPCKHFQNYGEAHRPPSKQPEPDSQLLLL